MKLIWQERDSLHETPCDRVVITPVQAEDMSVVKVESSRNGLVTNRFETSERVIIDHSRP